jgi:hypothetical protein
MDLINWTIREAENLTSEPREPSNVDVIPPFDEFLAKIQGKSPTDPGEPSALTIGNSSGIQTTGRLVMKPSKCPNRTHPSCRLPLRPQFRLVQKHRMKYRNRRS